MSFQITPEARPMRILAKGNQPAFRFLLSALQPLTHASARVAARAAPQKTPVNIGSARVHGPRHLGALGVEIMVAIFRVFSVFRGLNVNRLCQRLSPYHL